MFRRSLAVRGSVVLLVLAALLPGSLAANPFDEFNKKAPKVLVRAYPLVDALPATPPADPQALAPQARRFEQVLRDFSALRAAAYGPLFAMPAAPLPLDWLVAEMYWLKEARVRQQALLQAVKKKQRSAFDVAQEKTDRHFAEAPTYGKWLARLAEAPAEHDELARACFEFEKNRARDDAVLQNVQSLGVGIDMTWTAYGSRRLDPATEPAQARSCLQAAQIKYAAVQQAAGTQDKFTAGLYARGEQLHQRVEAARAGEAGSAAARTALRNLEAAGFAQLAELKALLALDARYDSPDWWPQARPVLTADGGGIAGLLGRCEAPRGETVEIHATFQDNPAYYKGPAVDCRPTGTGVGRYAQGARWAGKVATLPGQPYAALPVDKVLNVHPNGEIQLLQAQVDGKSHAYTRRYLLIDADGTARYGDFDDRWNASAGTVLLPDGTRIRAPLQAGKLQEPAVITLRTAHAGTPPGDYLLTKREQPLAEVGADDLWPLPATLRQPVQNVRDCPAPVGMPAGWVAWWPQCGSGEEGYIHLYSLDGRYLAIQAFRDGALLHTRLWKLDSSRAPVFGTHHWQAASFDLARAVPVGEAALYQSDRKLVFRGTFAGLEPAGEGMCPRPDADGEEPCEMRNGQRVDPAWRYYVALQEEKRRIAEAEERERQAQERLRAQLAAEEEAAERRRRAAQRAQNMDSIMRGVQMFNQAAQEVLAEKQRELADMEYRNAQLMAEQAEAQRRRQEQQQAFDNQQREERRQEEARRAASQQRLAELERQRRAWEAQQQQARLARMSAAAGFAAPASPASSARQQAGEPSARQYPAVPEAVEVCTSAGAAGHFHCYNSISANRQTVNPQQTAGWRTPDEWQQHAGNCKNGSRWSLNDGGVYWTCGFGVSGILVDAAARAGVVAGNRDTFYCGEQESYCKRRTPTGN